MAQGWHGNSEGHRRAGRLGGLRSAESRRRKAEQRRNEEFGEQIIPEVVSTRSKKGRRNKGADPSLTH